jgi:1-acyl-sn-glycerol-3-phosphate acyltransferase
MKIKKILLSFHVANAIFQVLLFPAMPVTIRKYLIKLWSTLLLKILCIKVVARGNLEFFRSEKSFLLVSNHISWLDIHVINAIRPVVFVAKADVSRWPIFGHLAKFLGTIFLNREKLSDIKRVIHLMKQQMVSENVVAVFPEGTSSDGQTILPFKSNLFQAAIDAERPVLPIKISYLEKGSYTQRTAFIGDMTLVESIKNILSSNFIEVEIDIFEPFQDPMSSRREISDRAYGTIKSKFHSLSSVKE